MMTTSALFGFALCFVLVSAQDFIVNPASLPVQRSSLQNGFITDPSRFIPHVAHTIALDNLTTIEQGVRDAVSMLLREKMQNRIYLPSVKSSRVPNSDEIQLERLTIATSNIAYKCTLKCQHDSQSNTKDSATESLFVRIFSPTSSNLHSRDQEKFFMTLAAAQHLGPSIYATFDNGYITEYLHGKALDVEDLHNPVYYRKIAKTFAEIHRITSKPEYPHFHNSTPATENKAGIWIALNQWLDQAENLPISKTSQWIVIKNTIENLEEILHDKDASNHVLCHNDLNHGNTFYLTDEDKIIFVDYEAAEFGDREFDLANHFCEWAGLDLDWEKLPTEEQKKDFMNAYFESTPETQAWPLSQKISFSERVEKYIFVSHAFWGVWATLRSEENSSVLDFNHGEYAKKRFAQFFRNIHTLL